MVLFHPCHYLNSQMSRPYPSSFCPLCAVSSHLSSVVPSISYLPSPHLSNPSLRPSLYPSMLSSGPALPTSRLVSHLVLQALLSAQRVEVHLRSSGALYGCTVIKTRSRGLTGSELEDQHVLFARDTRRHTGSYGRCRHSSTYEQRYATTSNTVPVSLSEYH